MVTHCWKAHELPMEAVSSSAAQTEPLLASLTAPHPHNSPKAQLYLVTQLPVPAIEK